MISSLVYNRRHARRRPPHPHDQLALSSRTCGSPYFSSSWVYFCTERTGSDVFTPELVSSSLIPRGAVPLASVPSPHLSSRSNSSLDGTFFRIASGEAGPL